MAVMKVVVTVDSKVGEMVAYWVGRMAASLAERKAAQTAVQMVGMSATWSVE